MWFDEASHRPVVHAAFLIKGSHGSAVPVVNPGRMHRGDGFSGLQGIEVPLEVFTAADLFVEGPSLPGAATVEAVRIAGSESETPAEVVTLEKSDAAAQGRIKFAEDGADCDRHRFCKSSDGPAVRLQERMVRRNGVSTQTQDPIMTGSRKAPVEGPAIGEVVLSDDEDLRALASGQFDRAVR